MKKIVTLVLAIALLMTSIVAIAETKATPNINTFAKMTTKFYEASATQAKRYEIKLSKPVTKLWVLWAEKGAEPEELAVDENLSATALAVEHKYMPGIKQSIGKSVQKTTSQNVEYKFVGFSEDEYGDVYPMFKEVDSGDKGKAGWAKNPVYFYTEVKKEDKWYLEPTTKNNGEITGYRYYYPVLVGYDEDLEEFVYTYEEDWAESLAEIQMEYEITHEGYTAEITEPTKVLGDKVVVDKFGNKEDKVIGYKDGYIQGVKTTTEVNKKLATNKATLGDRAFATLEGVTEDFAGWLVYRNRFGNFVAIEAYEGQL